MKKNTRDKLLEQAQILFSKNGFYGTSINDVAKEVKVSKQALLHHFSSKEKLYSAVLQKAAEQLNGLVNTAKLSNDAAVAQLSAIFEQMHTADEELLCVIILLLRELLDNRERVSQAHKWFLRPFLDSLVEIVERGQQQGSFSGLAPLAFVYQLLGASQYYLVSKPTLAQLYSKREFEQHQQQHKELLRQLLKSY